MSCKMLLLFFLPVPNSNYKFWRQSLKYQFYLSVNFKAKNVLIGNSKPMTTVSLKVRSKSLNLPVTKLLFYNDRDKYHLVKLGLRDSCPHVERQCMH